MGRKAGELIYCNCSNNMPGGSSWQGGTGIHHLKDLVTENLQLKDHTTNFQLKCYFGYDLAIQIRKLKIHHRYRQTSESLWKQMPQKNTKY